jgi:hypothetical protein
MTNPAAFFIGGFYIQYQVSGFGVPPSLKSYGVAGRVQAQHADYKEYGTRLKAKKSICDAAEFLNVSLAPCAVSHAPCGLNPYPDP